MKFYAEAKLY